MIDTSDIPPLTESFFAHAELRLPRNSDLVAVKVDQDTLAWFKAQGENWQERMKAALRLYAESHRTVGL